MSIKNVKKIVIDHGSVPVNNNPNISIIQIDLSALTKNEIDKLYYLLYETESEVESEINEKAIKDIASCFYGIK